MPFKAGQEAEAFKALMSAARQLELGLEFVTSNSSAVSEFDYGEVDFEEGLDQISSAWSSAVAGRDLRELCIRVEHDWIKAACGNLILTFKMAFQTGYPIELEFQFFGGSSWDKSFPGESSFWDLAEEQLSLGPEAGVRLQVCFPSRRSHWSRRRGRRRRTMHSLLTQTFTPPLWLGLSPSI